MLQPKQTKYRKQQKGRNRGMATTGLRVSFGEYGLKATTAGRITARQLEAARRAISRHVKRGGKLWIRVFPDKPITTKPLEVRQGKGKGNVEYWVAQVQAGRVLYEVEGVPADIAREAFRLAGAKLPREYHDDDSNAVMMQANELRKKQPGELQSLLLDLRREQFNLRMQRGAGQTVRPTRLQGVRREIARVKTVLHELKQGESA